MRTFILAGGFGTRLSEVTHSIPKPMIQIGNYPILMHIMSHYAGYGYSDFVILAGYKSEVIEQYFCGEMGRSIQRKGWSVEVIDTGVGTPTAGRLVKAQDSMGDTFMLTYGDGLSNVNVSELFNAHRKSQLIATVTAVRPPARFGTIEFENGVVTSFQEKNPQKTGWINGGFFCMSKRILDFIDSTEESLEGRPLQNLSQIGQLGVLPHSGFWHAVDTLRDQRDLEAIWASGSAPWIHESLV